LFAIALLFLAQNVWGQDRTRFEIEFEGKEIAFSPKQELELKAFVNKFLDSPDKFRLRYCIPTLNADDDAALQRAWNETNYLFNKLKELGIPKEKVSIPYCGAYKPMVHELTLFKKFEFETEPPPFPNLKR